MLMNERKGQADRLLATILDAIAPPNWRDMGIVGARLNMQPNRWPRLTLECAVPADATLDQAYARYELRPGAESARLDLDTLQADALRRVEGCVQAAARRHTHQIANRVGEELESAADRYAHARAMHHHGRVQFFARHGGAHRFDAYRDRSGCFRFEDRPSVPEGFKAIPPMDDLDSRGRTVRGKDWLVVPATAAGSIALAAVLGWLGPHLDSTSATTAQAEASQEGGAP